MADLANLFPFQLFLVLYDCRSKTVTNLIGWKTPSSPCRIDSTRPKADIFCGAPGNSITGHE